jgi:amylosucrase
MATYPWLSKQGETSLQRVTSSIEQVIPDDAEREIFLRRLEKEFPRLFSLLYDLYGTVYDFYHHLDQIILAAAAFYRDRPADLKTLDGRREADPDWFEHERMLGAVGYVDLFAGDLQGIREKIHYFEELGVTYLHLMPLFKAPEENSDGGYAVSDYRQVNPKLGTMQALAELAGELRGKGISLVLDFVFNHTSDEHEWARLALAGDEAYQSYYRMFDDRSLPDLYEKNLREIFPEQAPGSFTYRPEINKWVWTTFYNFQWDLNYANPIVFKAMLGEMLFLANQGVEILRLDAVAFIWKELGTTCESLPQAHQIIQAYNALVRIAAPGMIFKSEAIVHPAIVATYINRDECPISYNPTLMALLWEALATRQVILLRHSMTRRFDVPEGCAWVNYVRSHDDIGWSFADEDAGEIGINGFDHRQFLNQFYTGQFAGSFANGLPFNYNPLTRDMRISGTAASLAGLESALKSGDSLAVDLAVKRICLLYSVALSAGGIPLIYLGDEIAMLNDYGYRDDPGKAADSRWAHRPAFDWRRAENRHDESTPEGRVFQTLRRLIDVRKQTPAFGKGRAVFFDTASDRVLGYIRNKQLLVLANFSDAPATILPSVLRAYIQLPVQLVDLVSGETFSTDEGISLGAYQFAWLVR